MEKTIEQLTKKEEKALLQVKKAKARLKKITEEKDNFAIHQLADILKKQNLTAEEVIQIISKKGE